jgi:hypothetical protein
MARTKEDRAFRGIAAGFVWGVALGLALGVGVVTVGQESGAELVVSEAATSMKLCGPYYNEPSYYVRDGWVIVSFQACNDDNEVQQYTARWLRVE